MRLLVLFEEVFSDAVLANEKFSFNLLATLRARGE